MVVVGSHGPTNMRAGIVDERRLLATHGLHEPGREGVCHRMHLRSGVLWPMPITLDVYEEFAQTLKPGSSRIALRDPEGAMLAIVPVEEVWQPDREAEAELVFGSTSTAHRGVDYLLNKAHSWYVGGRIEGRRCL